MTGKKISELQALTELTGTEIFPIGRASHPPAKGFKAGRVRGLQRVRRVL